MNKPFFSEKKELQSFCEYLKNEGIICPQCTTEIEKNLQIVLIENPDWIETAKDTNFPRESALHPSCIVKLLGATKGFLNLRTPQISIN